MAYRPLYEVGRTSCLNRELQLLTECSEIGLVVPNSVRRETDLYVSKNPRYVFTEFIDELC